MARLVDDISSNHVGWLFGTDWDLIININDYQIWRALSEKVAGRVGGTANEIMDNLWLG